MSVFRIAIVSDDPILSEGLLRIIRADPLLTALPTSGDALDPLRNQRPPADALLVDNETQAAHRSSS
jgi:hypothetical protein